MKVHELIKLLSSHDGDMDVILYANDETVEIQSVDNIGEPNDKTVIIFSRIEDTEF